MSELPSIAGRHKITPHYSKAKFNTVNMCFDMMPTDPVSIMIQRPDVNK